MAEALEPAPETKGAAISLEEFDRIFQAVKNWGRWGVDDELGTLNYLTPERVAAATGLVRTGQTVSLSLPIDRELGPDNPRPASHRMTHIPTGGSGDPIEFAMDYLGSETHGNVQSHLDALCHVAYRGELYNGRPASVVTASGGASLGIDKYANGIVGRGVLLDIPALRGVEWLEPGESVSAAELEAAEARFGLHVEEGDILVFRTGQDRRRRVLGSWDSGPAGAGKAGLALDAVVWMHGRRVAAFLPDGDGETIPGPLPGIVGPVHALQIVAMGLAAADALDLEGVANACRLEGRYAFLVVALPLRLPGGTGSLINPIAIF
jgi:kynurenine formamidase